MIKKKRMKCDLSLKEFHSQKNVNKEAMTWHMKM